MVGWMDGKKILILKIEKKKKSFTEMLMSGTKESWEFIWQEVRLVLSIFLSSHLVAAASEFGSKTGKWIICRLGRNNIYIYTHKTQTHEENKEMEE